MKTGIISATQMKKLKEKFEHVMYRHGRQKRKKPNLTFTSENYNVQDFKKILDMFNIKLDNSEERISELQHIEIENTPNKMQEGKCMKK